MAGSNKVCFGAWSEAAPLAWVRRSLVEYVSYNYDEKGKSRSNRQCWSFSALFPAELLVNTCIILHYEREPRVNCKLARF